MSRIDDLIARHCPLGVRFVVLSDVADTVSGLSGKSKADFTRGNARFVSYKNVFANLSVNQSSPDFVKVEPGERQNSLRLGDVVFTGSSENVEEVGMSSVVLTEPVEPLYLNSFCFAVRFHEMHLLDPDFSKYLFRGSSLRSAIQKSASGVTRINISKQRFMKIRIPVPPVEVQREIVRTLDLFMELDAELDAELGKRRQQYAHYRDSLLTFPEADVRWVPMGEVTTIVRGASPRPIQAFLTDTEGGVPWIKIGDVPSGGKYITGTAEHVTPRGATKSRIIQPGDFVLSNSMSFGRPYISKIEGAIHDGWLAISEFGDSFLPDFLYHLLRSARVQADFRRRAGSSTVSNLNADIVRSVVVPVPELEEQERIVSILDKFDALVNDLSFGLPADINARRRQYEYYRDRLLTFEEAGA